VERTRESTRRGGRRKRKKRRNERSKERQLWQSRRGECSHRRDEGKEDSEGRQCPAQDGPHSIDSIPRPILIFDNSTTPPQPRTFPLATSPFPISLRPHDPSLSLSFRYSFLLALRIPLRLVPRFMVYRLFFVSNCLFLYRITP